jgi:hypothetical protein
MANMIDMILVIIVLGIAVGAVLKYFLALGKAPENESISCAGCHSGCHSHLPENQDIGLLRQVK